MDDYIRAVYMRQLRFRSEDTFKMLKAVAENETGNKVRKDGRGMQL
jgi:hypothetical protein